MSEHNEEIIFRSDDIERQKIAAHNKEAAERILQKAGIAPDNSEYQRYLALTESNVNSAGRYALFDEGVEKMFVETLKDPEMTLSQYETATKQYRIKAIEAQQTKADGGTFSDKDGNYKALREPYDETLKSGVAMRQENQITFPKEFYDENGLPNKRLVVELDANSAWTVVNDYAEKHSDIGLSFNGEMYGINGQLQSPGKFFESRASKLNNFLKAVNKSPEGLDLSDKELMDLVYKKDYEGIVELNKTRGMARDDRNKALRNLLKQDKDLFKEVGSLMLEADGDAEAFTKNVSQLSQKMKGNAELFHIETETGKFHAPKAEIDRVVFSVRPSDLAQQSTFQDWKSCMNAVGRYHSYVDDTIGQGSIIAYGYSSQNPQKMVSRVLINPYRNEKGETVYRPNNTLYGENNAVFRNAVGAVVEDKFNDVKESGIYHQAPGLYNDGDPYDILKVKKGEKCVDLSAYRGKSFYEADLSGVEKVILADGMVLDNVILPKDVSFGEKVVLKNTVLSDVDALGKVVLGEGVVLRNAVLPEGFKAPDNLTLDRVKLATDMSFGKNVSLRNMALPAGYKVPDGVILDNVILPKDVTFGKNVTLKNITLEGIDVPSDVTFKENVTFKNMTLPAGYKVPDGVTLDGLKLSPDVSFENKVTLKNMTLPEGLKVPDKAVLDNVTLASNMTFGKRVSLKNMRIPEGYKVPDEAILVNATLPQEVAFGKKVTFRGVNFANGGKVAFDDFSSSFKLDLSECSSVTFRGKEADLSNVKLPSGDKVHFQVDKVSLASIDDWNKLSSNEATGVKTIIVDEVPPKGAILSKNVSIYCGHSDLLILPQGKNLKSFAEEMFAGEADLSMKDEFLKTKGKRLKVYSAAEYSGEVTGEKAALKTMSQKAEARFNKKVTEAQFNKRVAEHTAENVAAKEAERVGVVKGFRNKVADAGEKVLTVAKKGNSICDMYFDNIVEKVARWDAPVWLQKPATAIDKAACKVIDNKVTRAGGQKLVQAAERFAKTKAGQKISAKLTKAAAKMGGEAAAKSAAKKIPLLCIALGLYFAGERLKNGQYVKACGEVLSGIVGNVPVYGTAASLGLDSAMLADDLKEAGIDMSPAEAAQLLKEGLGGGQIDAEHNPYASESTNVVNPYKKMNEALERSEKAAKSAREVKAAVKGRKKEIQQAASESLKAIYGLAPWHQSGRE